MAQRLNRPLTKIAGPFNGPVAIGQFEDGTLIVVGPDDEPIMIRHGKVMKLDPVNCTDEDMSFQYEGILIMRDKK